MDAEAFYAPGSDIESFLFDPSEKRDITGRWTMDDGSTKEANWQDVQGMSQAQWDKLPPAEQAALLAAVYVAEGDKKPGAAQTLAKMHGWVNGSHGHGGKGGGKSSAHKSNAHKNATNKNAGHTAANPNAAEQNHADGYIVGESKDGHTRMRWDKAHKYYVVETKSGNAWKEHKKLTIAQAHKELAKKDTWFRPKHQPPHPKPVHPATPAKAPAKTSHAKTAPPPKAKVKWQPNKGHLDQTKGPMVAAAEIHTGAMIALIPSEADAMRLAVDNGEDPAQLHITLAYLGEAATISDEMRNALIDSVSNSAAVAPTIMGNAFAVNLFNPDGGDKDTCVVLGVGGEQLDVFHNIVTATVSDVYRQFMLTMPEQHKPWVPHITLLYTDDADLSYFVDRVGPVEFDVVRLAFGGENYDIPLGEAFESPEEEASESPEVEAAEPVEAPAAGWESLLTFDADGTPIVPNVLIDMEAMTRERDVNSGPGPGHNLRNYWIHGEGAAKIGWKTPGDWTRCVAELGKYVKDPKGLCSEYHHQATGMWTGEKRHLEEDGGGHHDGGTAAFDTEMLYDTDGAAEGEDMTAASNSDKPYGDVDYADPGYQEDGKKRYPIDTEEHVRAAWSYINQESNAAKYDATQLKRVKARIQRAMKKIGADVNAEGETITAADAMPIAHPASWDGVLTVEGIESGDSRMFGTNALTWDELPLPLMWQKETSHGGKSDVSVRVGNIDKIWREPAPDGRAGVNFIKGSGTIDIENPDGAEVYRRMKRGYMRGNSVDVDSVKGADVELVFPESTSGPLAAEGDAQPAITQAFAQPELTMYKKGRIRASTLVEIPAFTEARLELTNGVTMDTDTEAAADADVAPEGDGTVEMSESDQAVEAIIAATSVIQISDAPPRKWFDEPKDVTPTGALTITDEGRIYGYVAPLGVRHRSFADRNVIVPTKRVDYDRFMGGETIVADGGRVSTGPITMNCGHASTSASLTASQAAEHYDNTCSMVATVRVGENRNGVWMAGALLPDITPEQVRRMMASRLSGDWRPHLDKPGWREFVAALLVPVPGFPMARTAPSVTANEGVLVASSVPVQLLYSLKKKKDEEPDNEVEDENENDPADQTEDDVEGEDDTKKKKVKMSTESDVTARIRTAYIQSLRAKMPQISEGDKYSKEAPNPHGVREHLQSVIAAKKKRRPGVAQPDHISKSATGETIAAAAGDSMKCADETGKWDREGAPGKGVASKMAAVIAAKKKQRSGGISHDSISKRNMGA